MATNMVTDVFGKYDGKPVAVSPRAVTEAQPVALMIRADKKRGTGFLIGNSLLITNNHVLRSEETAQGGTARFGYQADAQGRLEDHQDYPLNPGEYFYTDLVLDYSIVAVDGEPSKEWSQVDLGKLGIIGKGDHVVLLGHPDGRPTELVADHNDVLDVSGNFIHYTADTENISSGSPVFNDSWAPVALHHRGGTEKHGNEGVLLKAIVDGWPGRQ
jgi:endonuclease G, mitochondrial